MIETFVSQLPYQLGQQLNVEFENRLSEIKYLTSGKFHFYTVLGEQIKVVETLLAMSIFYKRVVTNLDSATKFSSRLFRTEKCDAVLIGGDVLDAEENRAIFRLILSFRELMKKYHINPELFQYLETKEFLRKVKTLYNESR